MGMAKVCRHLSSFGSVCKSWCIYGCLQSAHYFFMSFVLWTTDGLEISQQDAVAVSLSLGNSIAKSSKCSHLKMCACSAMSGMVDRANPAFNCQVDTLGQSRVQVGRRRTLRSCLPQVKAAPLSSKANV